MNESADKKFGGSLGNFPTLCVKHVSGVHIADAPPPCDHLPTVSVIAKEFDNAFHAHLASTVAFPVIVSAYGQAQARRWSESLCGP